MNTKTRISALILAIALLGSTGFSQAQTIQQGNQIIDGDLIVNGNLTVRGNLIVNGRVVAGPGSPSVENPPPPPPEPIPEPHDSAADDIFVRLWQLDQAENGLSVSIPSSGGGGEIRLNEQGKNQGRDDNALHPTITVVDSTKLATPTYRTLRALFDNYQPREGEAEDRLGSNPSEDAEIEQFLNAVMETRVMKECLAYLNQTESPPLTANALKDLLKFQWFALYTNHFGRPVPHSSGFEHVFVGEHDNTKIGGHHYWWKFHLDRERNIADSLGHNYGNIPGETYPWISTFRMRWTPAGPNTRAYTEPAKKGFFVGISPELTLAYGTLGLRFEKANGGKHPIVEIDGGTFELVIHASTLPGSGPPDSRRGNQIRSLFPILQSLSTQDEGESPAVEVKTVAQALASEEGAMLLVEGVIQGDHNPPFGLKLSATENSESFLAVKLPAALRGRFSPSLRPDARGTRVLVRGSRSTYTGVPGLIDVQQIDVAD